MAANEDSTAVESMEKIVAGYESFFSSPQKMISLFMCSGLCSGTYAVTKNYVVRNIAYDVQKTTSLVSPYTATVSFNASISQNTKCGNIRLGGSISVSSSEAEALKISRNESCFAAPYDNNDQVQIVYAYQKSKWTMKSAYHMGSHGMILNHGLLAVTGSRSDTSMPVIDIETKEFNRGWVATITP